MSPAADDGPVAVVIPFPRWRCRPNWACIDALAAEIGLWDPSDPWSLNDEMYPPQGVTGPDPGPVLRVIR